MAQRGRGDPKGGKVQMYKEELRILPALSNYFVQCLITKRNKRRLVQ